MELIALKVVIGVFVGVLTGMTGLGAKAIPIPCIAFGQRATA